MSRKAARRYFSIRFVDEETGRGVPLVEVRLPHSVRYFSDSNGWIALDEPSLWGESVTLYIRSPGYEYPGELSDGRGTIALLKPGGELELKMTRLNIAERLYRVTGAGIYRDSRLLGQPVPIRAGELNGKVMGQDTVIVTPFKDRLFWCWGDTTGPGGLNVKVSGATSALRGRERLNPEVGVNLNYFVDGTGFTRPLCPFPGPGRIWLDWIVSVRDEKGVARLVGMYSRMTSLDEPCEKGLAMLNERRNVFEKISEFGSRFKVPHLSIHPFRVAADGTEYFYFVTRSFFRRVQADLKHLADPEQYETFTCLSAGASFSKKTPRLDRDRNGRIRYDWKKSTEPIDAAAQQALVEAGKIADGERWWQLRDVETGAGIEGYPGSIFWNEYRDRWILLAQKGTGEVWYAEGDTPVGPWVYARRVAAHGQYNFYNITQHPFFDREGGRIVYFEGTYTNWFSANMDQTPRYDYNQLMYRLSLDDPRLFLPSPVYGVEEGREGLRYMMRDEVAGRRAWEQVKEIPFYAMPPDRCRENLVPVYAVTEGQNTLLRLEPPVEHRGSARPLFFALPVSLTTPEMKLSGVWQCKAWSEDGSEIGFLVEIKQEGGALTARCLQRRMSIEASTLSEDKVVFNLNYSNTHFTLKAAFRRGRLTGEWLRRDTQQSGTWEGRRVDFALQQAASSSVVFLYEYRRGHPATVFYSTNPALKGRGLKRNLQPICRVWQNPSSLLILDSQAKPA